jgi:cupin fold WbuC family metalloprotein
MRKIYSKVKPDVLLHVVNSRKEIGNRQDMCPFDEFLQVACFKLAKGKTFKPHKHVRKLSSHDITQENWIIIQGKIEAILYDLDDTILERVVLSQGDISITFRGGHNYLCLEDDTIVYENKTGPYLGIESDKQFI